MDHFQPNPTDQGVLFGIATNLNNGPNVPPSPVDERYAFIFMQDILDLYGSDPERYEAFWLTVAHELGHQRSGLTEPLGSYAIYHNTLIDFNGDWERDAVDVMDYGSLAYPDLPRIFCVDNNHPTGDGINNNSCYDNFIANFNAN